MLIDVTVKPNSAQPGVTERDGRYVVSIRATPERGAANRAMQQEPVFLRTQRAQLFAVLALLKKHFRAEVRLIAGAASRKKVVQVGSL